MDEKYEDFIKDNWGKLTPDEMSIQLSINLYDLLTIAYKMGMHKVDTPDIKRSWKKMEDQFLMDNAHVLTTTDACKLLYRSRYATYQRVKFLNLKEMIK